MKISCMCTFKQQNLLHLAGAFKHYRSACTTSMDFLLKSGLRLAAARQRCSVQMRQMCRPIGGREMVALFSKAFGNFNASGFKRLKTY